MDLSAARWRKSSYSGNDNDNCVEVADNIPDPIVPVRDSKVPQGPALIFGADAWDAFLSTIR
ncbi:DUF397 domain-containing protein [Streptomyces sp. SB3404]|uniref:DUF397 domain-containing protein n=1 Tax=Streptomyces boncukensis TaxID=2711219 RepID=A0A6G4X1F4_9ACTN|nr:DUF397 domain-containing protein [Streptomyces boncukensis]